LFSEGFNDISTLVASGWVMTNNSVPAGITSWFQGNGAIFNSHSGAPDSYIAANFDNAAFGGNISNWLISPMVLLTNGDILTFYARTEDPTFNDMLEVRLSQNGASSNVGGTATSVGDFTTLMIPAINPLPGGAWGVFNATVSGLGAPVLGRFAFRYVVTDTSVNGDYIGIDTVSDFTADLVPEPGTVGLSLAAVIFMIGLRRHRNKGAN
jgi:hypothetical protein